MSPGDAVDPTPVAPRPLSRLLIVLAATTAAPAAVVEDDEVRIDDLRLEYAPVLGREVRMSGHEDYSAPAAGQGYSATIAAQTDGYSHSRIGLAYVHSLGALAGDGGAFIVGLHAGYDRVETEAGSIGRTLVLDGSFGWAWAITPDWHLEQGVMVGGGPSHWRIHSTNAHLDGTDSWLDSDGWAYEYGVRLGTTYRWRMLRVGVEGRYLVMNTRQETYDRYEHNGIVETSRWRPMIRVEGLGVVTSLGVAF